VYGVFVWCPTDHLEPGVVASWSTPLTGILDVGRYPSGSDTVAEELASIFRDATFHSEARADIMRWKYRKLLMNLGNAVEALCGAEGGRSSLPERARLEGVACLNAANIPFVQEDEEAVGREKGLRLARSKAASASADRPGKACRGIPAAWKPIISTEKSRYRAAARCADAR
jgi:2-dehydropantoate 2-reductase